MNWLNSDEEIEKVFSPEPMVLFHSIRKVI